MSLPMAAGGPLKVEMKPIFTVLPCGSAGLAASASPAAETAPTFQVCRRMLLVMAFPSDFPAGSIMLLLIVAVERDAGSLCTFPSCRLVPVSRYLCPAICTILHIVARSICEPLQSFTAFRALIGFDMEAAVVAHAGAALLPRFLPRLRVFAADRREARF